MKSLVRAGACLSLITLFGLFQPVSAQLYAEDPPMRKLQIGLGFLPGVGAQAGIIFPFSVITVEGMSYAHLTTGNDSHLRLSAGVGGAIRLLAILKESQALYASNYELDAGFRVGPTFLLDLNNTSDSNVALFVEPFVRGSMYLSSGSSAFLEVGTQTPHVRVGVWLGF